MIVHAVSTAITVDQSPGSNDVVHAAAPAKTQVFQGESAHLPDLRNHREVMRSPDKELWIRAHREKLASLHANHT